VVITPPGALSRVFIHNFTSWGAGLGYKACKEHPCIVLRELCNGQAPVERVRSWQRSLMRAEMEMWSQKGGRVAYKQVKSIRET
jgi:hypothetical protein